MGSITGESAYEIFTACAFENAQQKRLIRNENDGTIV